MKHIKTYKLFLETQGINKDNDIEVGDVIVINRENQEQQGRIIKINTPTSYIIKLDSDGREMEIRDSDILSVTYSNSDEVTGADSQTLKYQKVSNDIVINNYPGKN